MKSKIKHFLPSFLKPKITGSWDEINKVLISYSSNPQLYMTNGLLIKFMGVKNGTKFTPYYFNKKNVGKLLLRKYEKCFYIPGDCGQIDIANCSPIFQLMEIPRNMWHINTSQIKLDYDIKFAPKLQYQYY